MTGYTKIAKTGAEATGKVYKGKMRISDGPRRAGVTGYTKIAKTGAEAAGKVQKREMAIP